MEYYGLAAVIAIVLIILVSAVKGRIADRKEFLMRLAEDFGRPYCNEEWHEEVNHRKVIRKDLAGDHMVSDKVCNDLDMDVIYNMLDQSASAIGEEYLYTTLRNPAPVHKLAERDRLAKEFEKADAFAYRIPLSGIRKQLHFTVKGFLNELKEAKQERVFVHVLLLLVFIASFVLAFVKPEIGIFAVFISAFINCVTYVLSRSKSRDYNYSISVIVKWLSALSSLPESGESELITGKVRELKSRASVFSKIKRVSWLFAPQNAVSSAVDTILDYLKFITHVDIIEFHFLTGFLNKHTEELFELYEKTGEFELGMIICGIRHFDYVTCVPEFDEGGEAHINAINMVHPLIENAVKNDACLTRNSLITGSNASGKSSYLKMVLLNCLLAETIATVFAEEYRASYLGICTSFDIKDDIRAGESFYISEIKRIKEMLERADSGEKLLIGIDEILKGTNTMERIAASAAILKHFSNTGCLVLAATHDVELTEILADEYENYYFTENPDDTGNLFDYKLRKGKNYNGNAIKLLEVFGYPADIIRLSRELVEKEKSSR